MPWQATFAAIQAAKRLRPAAKGVGTRAQGDALLGGAISVATVPPRYAGSLRPCDACFSLA